MNETENKAYALGIISRELGVDFESDLSPEELTQVNGIAEDAVSEDPKTDLGKKMKDIIQKEKSATDGDYNKGFNFHKELNNNKINPAAIFLFELFGKYAKRLVEKDEKAEGEMLSEFIAKLNELDFPTGYIKSPFNMISTHITKLNNAVQGQSNHREDEIEALAIGFRHPLYGTLSPHLASFKNMDDAIENLRTTFKFTEKDYRSE